MVVLNWRLDTRPSLAAAAQPLVHFMRFSFSFCVNGTVSDFPKAVGRLYARRLAYIMVYYIINAIEWINWLKQFYNLSKHVHDQQQLRACAVLGVSRWSLDIGHWTWLAMMASWVSKRSGLFVPLESAARQDELALLLLLELCRVSFAVNWFALLHCWRPQISSSSSLCTIYIKMF